MAVGKRTVCPEPAFACVLFQNSNTEVNCCDGLALGTGGATTDQITTRTEDGWGINVALQSIEPARNSKYRWPQALQRLAWQ